MLVFVNALSANDGGGQTYIKQMLINTPSDIELIVLVNPKNAETLKRYGGAANVVFREVSVVSLFSRTLWEVFILPFILMIRKCDIYFAPGGLLLTFTSRKIKTATALRNMLLFSSAGSVREAGILHGLKNLLLRSGALLSYRVADKVVFISNHSRAVVASFYRKVESKSAVIRHGFDEGFGGRASQLVTGSSDTVGDDYFLYVSSFFPYKKQLHVLEEFDRYKKQGGEKKLLLIGSGLNGKYGGEVKQRVINLGLERDVVLRESVDHEALSDFYRSAHAFIFASTCECCPNILIEMLHFNKVILCSSVEPMPEFGQDRVTYFSVDSIGALSDLMLKVDVGSLTTPKAPSQNVIGTWAQCFSETFKFIKE